MGGGGDSDLKYEISRKLQKMVQNPLVAEWLMYRCYLCQKGVLVCGQKARLLLRWPMKM